MLGQHPMWLHVKVVLKKYRIRRASASARMLCPFLEYSPVFQKGLPIISEGPDGYRMISEGKDKYCITIRNASRYWMEVYRLV
jgi:hypothetical protein